MLLTSVAGDNNLKICSTFIFVASLPYPVSRNTARKGLRLASSLMNASSMPVSKQAAKALAEATPNRLLWYLVPPADLVANVHKAFR